MTNKLEHVVFFRLRDLTNEEEATLVQKAYELKNQVEGVLEISFGKSITSLRAQVLLDSAKRLDFYRDHPDHQAFATFIKNYKGEEPFVCALDWERA